MNHILTPNYDFYKEISTNTIISLRYKVEQLLLTKTSLKSIKSNIYIQTHENLSR